MNFDKKLMYWYLQNKRTMPWRQIKNPYNIWLSEVILQQTRVEQGLPYYLTFTEAFPTVFDLAKAPEETVLKLWQGLGYYSRARNLHFTAKHIAEDCNGVFPKQYKGLLKLKGVGDYTASAIASICYNEATPVVDGNVYRVLSRYFGITTPINSSQGIKEFKKLATAVMNTEDSGEYNQAIMEFGAIQCKPGTPDCNVCPLNDSCVALATKQIGALPVKLKKLKVTKQYFNYLFFVIKGNKTIIQQRTGKGIWQKMYEFPLIQATEPIPKKEINSLQMFKSLVGTQKHTFEKWNEEFILHKLSHQHLYTNFYIIEMHEAPAITQEQKIVSLDELLQYPVPVLINNFIEDFNRL